MPLHRMIGVSINTPGADRAGVLILSFPRPYAKLVAAASRVPKMAETKSREAEPDCLHCELTKLIQEHLERQVASGVEVNMADVSDKIVESLADFLLGAVPAEERATMIAYALEHLGRSLRVEEDAETRH
jgi:hypothetical protein